jgi:hypothetical protein
MGAEFDEVARRVECSKVKRPGHSRSKTYVKARVISVRKYQNTYTSVDRSVMCVCYSIGIGTYGNDVCMLPVP